MVIVIIAFLAVFVLLASGGLLLFHREAMMQRISTVLNPRTKQAAVMGAIGQTGAALGGVMEQLERLAPKSKSEVSVVQQRLIRAGYRNDGAVKIFYGTKVAVPLILCFLLMSTGLGASNPFIYVVALGVGYLLPDFWLGRRITKRQTKIRRGLPDVLDLLVICIEAGLGMDQATARTTQELALAHPILCEELGIVMLEQRAGCPRSEAWRHFAERSDVEIVRSLVAVLVQSEQFGTSIAKTLRMHSDNLRTQRRQQVEEQAAKTTVKLVFPLVLFIFPSLFLVTLGPAMIVILEGFKTYFH